MSMLDASRRLAAGAIVIAALLSGCSSGDSGPTTTQRILPTSEVIFSLTTTTSTPPGPLDPVFVESLAITIDIPRDWEYRTDALRFGRASAAFRADNRAGALIVVGAAADVLPDGDDAVTATPDDLAPILATLLDVTEPLPEGALTPVGEPVTGTSGTAPYVLQQYSVVEESGDVATLQIAVYQDLDPVVFVAVLYQNGLPEDRIEQTQVFDTLQPESG